MSETVPALLVAAVCVLVLVALPPGRRVLSALLGSVRRWPGLVRAELRGAAPLRVDGADHGPGHGSGHPGSRPSARPGDTTPDIPVVTRGLPIVERPATPGSR